MNLGLTSSTLILLVLGPGRSFGTISKSSYLKVHQDERLSNSTSVRMGTKSVFACASLCDARGTNGTGACAAFTALPIAKNARRDSECWIHSGALVLTTDSAPGARTYYKAVKHVGERCLINNQCGNRPKDTSLACMAGNCGCARTDTVPLPNGTSCVSTNMTGRTSGAIYTWSNITGKYYSLFNNGESCVRARTACQGDGADLAITYGPAGKLILETFLLLSKNSGFWVAGSDEAQEGTWLFPDGVSFTVGQKDNRTNWHPLDPNGGTWENCIAGYKGVWVDANCIDDYNNGYLCEMTL